MMRWFATYDDNVRARHVVFFVGLWLLFVFVLINGAAGLLIYCGVWLGWRSAVRTAKAAFKPPVNGRPPIQWRQDRER